MAKQTTLLPACRNMEIYSGDTFIDTIILTDSSGAAIDLSAADVVFTIKKKKADSKIVAELSIGSGITISGAGNNEINISSLLVDSDGNQLAELDYYYDLQITFASGVIRTVLAGEISVIYDITR